MRPQILEILLTSVRSPISLSITYLVLVLMFKV